MTEIGADWRVLDGVATAWFDAPSLIEGAALAGRIVELSAGIVVDLRATGIRVRLDSDEHAEAVSAVARDLGLAANHHDRCETASTSTWCGGPRRSSRRVLARHRDRSGSVTPTPKATSW